MYSTLLHPLNLHHSMPSKVSNPTSQIEEYMEAAKQEGVGLDAAEPLTFDLCVYPISLFLTSLLSGTLPCLYTSFPVSALLHSIPP